MAVYTRGCNADCRTKRGCTPFFLACKEGHQKVSQLLLEHSADPEVCVRTCVFVYVCVCMRACMSVRMYLCICTLVHMECVM